MAENQKFNRFFFAEQEKEILANYQESRGCFGCGKPGATQKCSQCGVVFYCNRKCQKIDWKKHNHKETCNNWIVNTAGGPSDPESSCIPVCMKASGWIEEPQDFMDMMAMRQYLLFNEAKRVMRPTQGRRLSFTLAVVNLLGNGWKVLRLNAFVEFEDMTGQCHTINHVLLECVVEGEEAYSMLYPPDGSSGDLSEKSKERVITKLVFFVETLQMQGFCVEKMTYGRGLMRTLDNDQTRHRIGEVNGEFNGEKQKIDWIPDMMYLMKDTQMEMSKAFISSLTPMFQGSNSA